MTAQPAGEPPVTTTDESRLALAFQRGEDGAYDVIYRRYSEVVRRHCERILCDAEDAQDAVQETFLRVYNRLDSFNGRWLLEAWIKRIATNICLDKLRQRNRRSGEPAAEALHGAAFVRAAEDPEHVAIRRAEVGGVLKKIEALPELQRDAVVLRDVHDLPHRDIAAVLRISEARARVLIHRAHKALRGSRPLGLVISFAPRLWRKLLRGRIDSPEPVAAYVYQTSAHVTEVVDTAGLFFKHGGSVAHGIATVAAAAVVSAGPALPVAGAGLPEHFKSFVVESADDRVGTSTASSHSGGQQASSNDGRPMLAQVTGATSGELEDEPLNQNAGPEEADEGEAVAAEAVVLSESVSAESAVAVTEAAPQAAAPEAEGATEEEAPTVEPVPAEDVPAEEVPTEETEVEEAPAEEVPAEEVPAEEVPAEEVPAEEVPAEEVPAEEVTVESPTAESPTNASGGTKSPTTEPSTSPSTSPVTEPSTSPSEPSSPPAETP